MKMRKPSDFHVHLRERPMLAKVIGCIAKAYHYFVAMGNTKATVKSGLSVKEYREEIETNAFLQGLFDIHPIMSVMLVRGMTPKILKGAYRAGALVLKLIPGRTSTESEKGVALWDLPRYYPVLQKAMELDMIFSVHCELALDPETKWLIPLYDQERLGIPYFDDVIKTFPRLKMIFEHASSRKLCDYFLSLKSECVAVGLTGHHPYIRYSDVCDENRGINPYLFCKPVGKFEDDIAAVRSLMTSGHPRVIFGSDFAPHSPYDKAFKFKPGIFSLPEAVIPDLWENVFFKELGPSEETERRFQDFTSGNGIRFYGLPDYDDKAELVEDPWTIPMKVEGMKVFQGGKRLNWRMINWKGA